MQPLVSVVIANYNYGRFLEDAINSIIAQGMDDKIELIICDAASTDNSVEIIKKYANSLPPNTSYEDWRLHNNSQLSPHNSQLLTWWCSEKDGGQSAAFNKGFSHARGAYLTWLNADDVLLPKTISRLSDAIMKNPDAEWFGGGCLFLDPALHIYKCARGRHISKSRISNCCVNVTGPSSFFSRELYLRAGKIDERFQYTMDTDLWLRFAKIAKATYVPFSRYIWGMRLHDQAKMSGHKFAGDGRILEGRESQEAFQRYTERLEQIRREEKWTKEKVGCEGGEPSRIKSLISASIFAASMSRVDTWRFKGMHYLEVCK